MTCQNSVDNLSEEDEIARVTLNYGKKNAIDIKYLENETGDGWNAYVCSKKGCCLAYDKQGSTGLSDRTAIVLGSWILNEIGIHDIPVLRLQREHMVTMAMFPYLMHADYVEL